MESPRYKLPTIRDYIPVAGTFARRRKRSDAWYLLHSPLDRLLYSNGFLRVDQDRDPNTPDRGYWSGDLNGLLVQRIWPWTDPHEDWLNGGQKLAMFILKRFNAGDFKNGLVLLTHSHGGQVAAYALNTLHLHLDIPCRLRIHVIDVDMPVRRDMEGRYATAMHRSASWTHLHSSKYGWRSRMRYFGNGWNGQELPGASRNVPMAGGHSGILSHPKHRLQWVPLLNNWRLFHDVPQEA